MITPRMRRLAADHEAVRAELSGHPYVQVTPLGPVRPPESYSVILRVTGLRLEGDTPRRVDEHEVEIQLPLGYPREAPLCIPVSEIFHPNILGRFCLADYWAAGQGLVDTIAKVADIIQYRIFNPSSPLDAVAARWADANRALFPLGNVTLGTPEIEITLGSRGHEPARDPVTVPAIVVPDLAPVEPVVQSAPDADDDLGISLRRVT